MRRFDPGLHNRKHLNRNSPGLERRTGSKIVCGDCYWDAAAVEIELDNIFQLSIR